MSVQIRPPRMIKGQNMGERLYKSEHLYLQIAENIELAILNGEFVEGQTIIKASHIMHKYGVGRTTAGRAIRVLKYLGALNEKPGIGSVVVVGVKEKIKKRRMSAFKEQFINPMLDEARCIGLNEQSVCKMIEEGEDYHE